jgi:methionyl-tRNA synthetase
MANAPESSDSNFTWEHFAATVNKDLADVVGNFVNRVMRFCATRFDAHVPGEGAWGDDEFALAEELDRRVRCYTDFLEAFEFRKAVAELRAIWVAGNEYMTRAAPWSAIREDRARAAVGVRVGLNLVHLFGHLSWPIVPDLARKMHEAIMPAHAIIPWPDQPMREFLDQLDAEMPVRAPDVLVAKITDEQIAEWQQRFAGEGSQPGATPA